MALLAIQRILLTGLNPTLGAAAAGGDEFPNGGRDFFWVDNGSAASVTVTVNSVRPCDQGVDHDITVAVPAAEQRLIGPFEPRRFNNTSGRVAVSYSAVTSVTVAAVEV